MSEAFHFGQQVIWRHEMRGGYGYTEAIQAVVVAVTPKRVRIRVGKIDGSSVMLYVTPDRLQVMDGGREDMDASTQL
jgi:hypothetical protein